MNDTQQSSYTLETAPTEYVDAAGIRFAYRAFGNPSGVPLLFLQHFTGNMDSWDPAVVNGLSKHNRVIVFDNTGVGRSTGATPDNVEQMTVDAAHFISALGYTTVNLLGYSLGGFIAQRLASDYGSLAAKLVLVATGPQGGEEHLLSVLADAMARKGENDIRLPLFFTGSEASQAAGRAFLKRATARVEDRDIESGDAVAQPQAHALITWCATPDPEHRVLRAIEQPALIVGGSNDTMLPPENAYAMFKQMKDARLVLYPDSGHGVLFQYPEIFVEQVEDFLSER
jgi:pimeloyl-ACP methyl ester carboxylesterase